MTPAQIRSVGRSIVATLQAVGGTLTIVGSVRVLGDAHANDPILLAGLGIGVVLAALVAFGCAVALDRAERRERARHRVARRCDAGARRMAQSMAAFGIRRDEVDAGRWRGMPTVKTGDAVLNNPTSRGARR